MRSIRVVLADDHVLVRQGIKALLTASRICVEDEAEDGRSLIRAIRACHPDIALVDVFMPLLNGIEAIPRIKQVSPETRVIVLSMFGKDCLLLRAKRAGADGYVLKEEAPEQLLDAIEAVATGGTYFPTLPEKEMVERVDLTPREREVLQLIVEGRTTKEIAQVMTRSLYTVRNHRVRLMKKLGARTSVELVQTAEDLGLVRLVPARREK